MVSCTRPILAPPIELNHFMQVITTPASAQANKTAQSPQEKRFDAAWKRVIDQQKTNDEFRKSIQEFGRSTRPLIQDQERAYMDAMYGACLHLLKFFSRKSLTQWQRLTLIDWISEYLKLMLANPFCSHLDMNPIRQGLADGLASAFPDSQDLSESPEDDSDTEDVDESNAQEENTEDMFQDMFAEFEEAQDQANAQKADFRQQHDESQALKWLMRSSSITSLFRKIAGVLHPDKEPDETLRREKNRLMGELIQARNTNDVPRLFAFYTEYVGRSPLQELGEDLDAITQLLERQYQQLCAQKERILFEEPIAGVLFQQLHKKTSAATKRAINSRLKEVRAKTDSLQALPREVTSLSKLRPYLELHYEMLALEESFV